MKKRNLGIVAGSAAVLALTVGGTATAASLITHHDLADSAVHSDTINDGGVHQADLGAGIAAKVDAVPGLETQLAAGAQVLTGLGQQVATLPKQGLDGAYYALAKYDVGDTNGGAVATVACSNQTDVAISGGVQTIALGDNGIGNNVPVSSSFPGRMNWDTNSPRDGRLDGWIVQFGTETGNAPKYVNIYALCVPGADISVVKTYSESGN
jgi:hypothetical protein